MKIFSLICVGLLGMGLLASNAPAAVKVVASEDTYIVKGQPYPWNYNHDNRTYIWGNNDNSKVRRTLLKIDLSSYAGQTVSGDATFHILLGYQNQSRNASIGLYQIDSTNAAWVTGSGNSTTSPKGANWNTSVYEGSIPWKDADGNSLGTTSGLGGPVAESPTDTTPRGYEAAPLDVVTLPNTQTANFGDEQVWLQFTIPQAVVQDWIDHPSDNAGVLLRYQDETNVSATPDNINSSSGGDAMFYSIRATGVTDSSGSSIDVRPYISFAVPEPASLGLLGMGGWLLAMRRRK